MRAPPPRSDEARGQAGIVRGQGEANSADCAASDDSRRKRAATLRAQLALAGGFELHELADGTFLARRWGLTRHLRDLAAVEAFARQVGAA